MSKTTLIVMTTAAICMTLSTAQAVPVAVPEPTTVISGALLLIPLGVGAARSIFKNRGKK